MSVLVSLATVLLGIHKCFERTQRPVHNHILRCRSRKQIMAEKTLCRVVRRITQNENMSENCGGKTSTADGVFQPVSSGKWRKMKVN